MKTKSIIIFLSIIYIICLIPTIYIYYNHGYEEFKGYQKSISNDNQYKATKQLGESILFISIGVGYIFFSVLMFAIPHKKLPYLFLLIGTVAVIVVYFFRIFGIPIPFTDIVIRDLSTDWRDVATKIPQFIMMIPLSMLYIIRATKIK